MLQAQNDANIEAEALPVVLMDTLIEVLPQLLSLPAREGDADFESTAALLLRRGENEEEGELVGDLDMLLLPLRRGVRETLSEERPLKVTVPGAVTVPPAGLAEPDAEPKQLREGLADALSQLVPPAEKLCRTVREGVEVPPPPNLPALTMGLPLSDRVPEPRLLKVGEAEMRPLWVPRVAEGMGEALPEPQGLLEPLNEGLSEGIGLTLSLPLRDAVRVANALLLS